MAQVLRLLPAIEDPNVLVGTNTADDAAVYKISEDLALVQTVDFFTPVVDDPYTFGMIAAANSLSDIYAMVAQPLFALNVAAFPSKTLPLEALAQILLGGADKAREAGVSVIGGHTIEDKEPKYGMVVTALIHPQQAVANAGALPGDIIFLTKPLGLGIITTAMKSDQAPESVSSEAIAVMAALNDKAAEAMVEVGVHACTDVTGFGLLGHLHEMVAASGVGARISLAKIPVISGTWELVARGIAPGGTKRNLAYLEGKVNFAQEVSPEARLVLADAQTSGGLLMAVPPERAGELASTMQKKGISAAPIGEIIADETRSILVES